MNLKNRFHFFAISLQAHHGTFYLLEFIAIQTPISLYPNQNANYNLNIQQLELPLRAIISCLIKVSSLHFLFI